MVDRNETTVPAADDPVEGGDDIAAGHDDPVAGGDEVVARLAGAPISWGVCEVPGWGLMLPPDRVFAEMAALGLTATELGPIGYLPYEPAAIHAALDRHGLRLVGGFVPLVVHHADLAPALEAADRSAGVLAEAGADTFNVALVADDDWGAPVPFDGEGWKRLGRNLAEVAHRVEQHG